jgi:adenylosuccinate lyase
MLDRFAWLVEGLVVDADRMRRNLEAWHGLVFSPRVQTALVEAGLARDDAYRLVQAHALRSWEEELDFRSLLERDPAVAGRLAPDTLSRAFDLEDALQHVDVVFERLTAIVHQEEEEEVHA